MPAASRLVSTRYSGDWNHIHRGVAEQAAIQYSSASLRHLSALDQETPGIAPKNLSIVDDIRRQSSASRASCFRPAGVIV